MRTVLIGCCAYQGKPFNEVWLETLLQTTKSFPEIHSRHSLPDDIEVRIMFVDNGCTDGTMESLTAISDAPGQTKQLHYRRLGENRGICTGWNHILHEAVSCDADFVVITNNDIAFGQGWLPAILDQMDKFPLVGRMHLSSSDEPDIHARWTRHRTVASTKEDVYLMLERTYGSVVAFDAFARAKNTAGAGKVEERYAATSFIMRRQLIHDVGFYDSSFSPRDLHEDADYDRRMDTLRAGRADGKWLNRWSLSGYVHHFICQTRMVHLHPDDWVSAREHGWRTKYGSGSGLCDNAKYFDWCTRNGEVAIP